MLGRDYRGHVLYKYLSYYSERLLSTYPKTHTHTHTVLWDTVTTTLGITRSTFVHSPSGKFVVSWPHSFNMDKLHQHNQSLCSLSPISLTHNCAIILTVVTFPSSESSKGNLGKKEKKHLITNIWHVKCTFIIF